MPDFRKNIEDAGYKPQYENQTTTGPNAEGSLQTWSNPDQLTKSSAQELASLMGATLSQVNMIGPYAQQKPQWQLDFSPAKGDELNATMVYDQYRRAPEHFNQMREDELKLLRGPLPPGVLAAGDDQTAAEKGARPINPIGPGPGPGPGPGGTAPGPGNWTPSPTPNVPGPNVPITPLPGPTGEPPTTTVGETIPGGYTRPPLPPAGMPPSLLLNTPQQKAAINYDRAPGPTTRSPSLYPNGLLSPNMTFDPIPKQNLANNGLLGLVGPDGKPLTRAEILAFSGSKKSLADWLADKYAHEQAGLGAT